MPGLVASLAEEDRRKFRRLLVVSAAVHAALLVALTVVPAGARRTMLPGVISVDLVALPGSPGPAASQKAARPAQPETPPAVPKPPPRVAKKVVLPEQPQKPIEPPKPAAKAEPPPAKTEPAPKPEAPPASKPQAEAEYEDVLAQLRQERGEARPEQARSASAGAGGGRGVPVSAAVAAWVRAARGHVRRSWVLAPGFRTELLETHVEVELDAAGNVRGDPRVTRRSGNPWYDESVVRAIQKASPLPPPPKAGRWPFIFRPEEY